MLPLVGNPVPAHLPIRRPTLEAQAVEEANTTSLRPADIRADPVDLGRPLYRDANLPVGTALVGAGPTATSTSVRSSGSTFRPRRARGSIKTSPGSAARRSSASTPSPTFALESSSRSRLVVGCSRGGPHGPGMARAQPSPAPPDRLPDAARVAPMTRCATATPYAPPIDPRPPVTGRGSCLEGSPWIPESVVGVRSPSP